MPSLETIADLPTPALVVDRAAFERNRSLMTDALPGARLRPHIKAFKSTAVARLLADAGHAAFCCATLREVEGLQATGLGEDVLLANETLDVARLREVVTAGPPPMLAVDSVETIDAAVLGGAEAVLIDVNVGLPRCGCAPTDAGRLADEARSRGLDVRGVMGYEGHLMDWTDRDKQRAEVERSMVLLTEAHELVGGDIVSAGGTGTYDLNTVATEIQAGSYLFMDTHYAKVGLPFVEALWVVATVISTNPEGWAVADAGLKALAMDHGNPTSDTGEVFFCSDEHTTILTPDGPPPVGSRVRLRPAHVDPTIAKHPVIWVADGDTIVDQWLVDLRDW